MCPEGSLSKKKFIEVSKYLYGDQAKNLSENIFNIFDEDQSGHIDFVEYMMAINSSNMHTPESKLNWIFNVFDKVLKRFDYIKVTKSRNSSIFLGR